MRIGLGSNRAAKIVAVHAAIARIATIDAAWSNAEIITRDVKINAPAMPLSEKELMSGARERAFAVRSLLEGEGLKADIFIGLEGGFDTISIGNEAHTFLCGWAFATDGFISSYGAAPAIMVPDSIARRVIENNLELAHVIDEVSGEADVRNRQGAWGVLSCDLFKRADSFETALIAALAPFYNSKLY